MGNFRWSKQILLRRVPDDGAKLWSILFYCSAHNRDQRTVLCIWVSFIIDLKTYFSHWTEKLSHLSSQLSLPSRTDNAGYSDHRWHPICVHDEFSLPHIVQRSGHHSASFPGRSRLHREANRSAKLAEQSDLPATSAHQGGLRERPNGEAEILLHV